MDAAARRHCREMPATAASAGRPHRCCAGGRICRPSMPASSPRPNRFIHAYEGNAVVELQPGAAMAAAHRRRLRLSAAGGLAPWPCLFCRRPAPGSAASSARSAPAIGSAAGALAGYALDRALLTGTQRVDGPRLSGPRPFSAEEGAPLPARLRHGPGRRRADLGDALRGGEHDDAPGGKGGGAKVTEYRYFANSRVRALRGADRRGRPRLGRRPRARPRPAIEMRVHRGGEDQLPDPLIDAKQGAATRRPIAAPPMSCSSGCRSATIGNRIPQLPFEVMRPVGARRGGAAGGHADPRRDRVRL